MAKTAPSSTAVALRSSREVGHLVDRAEHAKSLGLKSRSPRTRAEYKRQWRKFEAWCRGNDLAPMPSEIATLCLYVSQLVADGCAISTLDQAMAAIRYTHRMKRLDKAAMPDWQDIRLLEVMQGARRDIASRRGIKRAKPISREHMRVAFEMLDKSVLREARDLAILALAYAGCRRRSEIAGLDYQRREEGSDGTGILEISEEGITILLLRSKTSQAGEPKKFFIHRKHFPACCEAIEAWIKIAGIAPGTPVLRGITTTAYKAGNGSGHPGIRHYPKSNATNPWLAYVQQKGIGYYPSKEAAIAAQQAYITEHGIAWVPKLVRASRYADQNISLRIQRCMAEVLKRQKLADTKRKHLRPEEVAEIRLEAAQFSGHSGRRGSLRDHFKYGGTRADASAMSGHVPGSGMLDLYAEDTDVKSHEFGRGSGL